MLKYVSQMVLSLTQVLLRLIIGLEQIYRAWKYLQFWAVDFVIYSYTLHIVKSILRQI